MAKQKAHRLRDLVITKVDFVDAGCNQRADIKLTKRAPGPEANDLDSVCGRIASMLAKALGFNKENAPEADEHAAVKKDARTFQETMNEQQKREIFQEIWRVTSALEESLCSICGDDEVADKATILKQSIDEFSALAKQAAEQWCQGKAAGIRKKAGDETKPKRPPKDNPKPGDPDPEQDENGVPTESTPKKDDKKPSVKKNTQEEETEMKINKNLLSEAELAFLDAIEKKAGTQEPEENATSMLGNEVKKVAQAGQVAPVVPEALQQIMERIDKRLADAENEKLIAVAKKYELLGVKAEEIMPVLKKAQEEPEVYGQFVKRMDNALAAVEKAGIFEEIGKRGGMEEPEASDANEAWAQVEKKAAEICKARPELSIWKARDMVCQEHPELAAKLD